MAKYIPDEAVTKTNEFDKHVGAFVTVLSKFGVSSVPPVKAGLLYQFCEDNGIDMVLNRKATLILMSNLEESLLQMLY